MKIAATIKGCYQTGENEYQDTLSTYLFDTTATIQEILDKCQTNDISTCNLAMVKEQEDDSKRAIDET